MRLALGAAVVAACAGRTPASRAPAAEPVAAYTAEQCPHCAEWNAPHEPVKLAPGTYWVGTDGLGSILVTSSAGHVLIDGALPESAAQIEANIRTLGFRVEDVKLILSSHTHYDHAGGIAALQRASGARVAASPWSARELRRGAAEPDDPQAAIALPYPAVHEVRELADGETVRVGPLALTAHVTPGHTPGGTTWSWRSCEGASCVDVVYADSLTPVSQDGYRFTDHAALLAGFAHSFEVIEKLPCDVLITPHPGASDLWDRVKTGKVVDRDACKRYAAVGRENLAKRVASESGSDGH